MFGWNCLGGSKAQWRSLWWLMRQCSVSVRRTWVLTSSTRLSLQQSWLVSSMFSCHISMISTASATAAFHSAAYSPVVRKTFYLPPNLTFGQLISLSFSPLLHDSFCTKFMRKSRVSHDCDIALFRSLNVWWQVFLDNLHIFDFASIPLFMFTFSVYSNPRPFSRCIVCNS